MSSLWQSVLRGARGARGALHGAAGSLELASLAAASGIERLEALRGRSVLLASHSQFAAACALLELDGVARRITLCTPDLSPAQQAAVAGVAEADAAVLEPGAAPIGRLESFHVNATPSFATPSRESTAPTEWVLLTSGTTGMPKLVLHTLDSLVGAVPADADPQGSLVWSTFYDIRRYGGLQIYLRALLAGSSLVLSAGGESVHDFLTRAARWGVTHISGTPSHWRRAMMSGDARIIAPRYVRLSGEIADQPVLDNLRAAYPNALVAHAFASTEAGVLFEVNDGLSGFPVELVERAHGDVELKIIEGTLCVRSSRLALRYLGPDAAPLRRADGFVDTGDVVEATRGRYHFRGRHGGIINVGGLKVYPQEVEAVLNEDPRVQMSLVKARRNPLTGAVIVAEVLLRERAAGEAHETLIEELLERCRRTLSPHKVPAVLKIVASLEMTASGKLVRPRA